MYPDEAKQRLIQVRERVLCLEDFAAARQEVSPFYIELLLELQEVKEAVERAIQIYQKILDKADG